MAKSISTDQSTEKVSPVRLPWLLTANTRLEALFDADIGEL